MAEEKIQLNFGGKYSAGEAFKQGQQDVKNFVKAHKDMVGSAKAGLSQIAGSFSGELNTNIRASIGLLQQLATGGIWGAMSAGVSIFINKMVELKQKAEEYKQQMEDMRVAHQRLLDAQVAAAEAMRQGELDKVAEKAAAAVAEVDKLASAFKGLAAAEDASMGAGFQLKVAKINDEFSKRLAEACDELKPLVSAERALALAENEQVAAREQQTRAIERERVALNECDQKIELQKKAIEALTAAGSDTTEAYKLLSKLQMERTAQAQRLQTAEQQAETSALQHATAVRDATAAVKKAEIAWEKAVDENEKANIALEDKAYMDKKAADITRICMKNQVEANAYIKLFGDCMAKCMTESEAYAELQKKLNEDLKKRADAEERAAKDAERKKKEEQKAFANTVLNIDPDDVKEGVGDWDRQTTYSNMRKDMAEDAHKEREEMARMNAELAPFMQLLKGNMPQTMADEYAKALMKSFSQDQMKSMFEEAMRRQLISLSDQRSQKRTFEKMLNCMEKAGLK